MADSLLGLVGPSGLVAAQRALRQIREDQLREQMIQRENEKQQIDINLAGRKQDEIERAARQGETFEGQRVGYEGQRVGFEGTRLGFEGQRLGFEGNQDQRAAAEADRRAKAFQNTEADRAELTNMIRVMPGGPTKQLMDFRRLGVDANQDELYTPSQQGQRVGEKATAAWQGGGRQVFTDQQRIDAENRPPSASGEPLVPVQGPNGTIIYAPRSQAAGQVVGRGMASGALDQLSGYKSAHASLQDLRDVLKENEQYIGPVAGLQALNPYSDARKAQAKIDLVRQRVGKTLEGGVLRKEDEEKYKKILATLTDTPSTAISKIDNLIQTIERDAEIYAQTQAAGGRSVPDSVKLGGAGGGGPQVGTKRTVGGKTYEWDGKGWIER